MSGGDGEFLSLNRPHPLMINYTGTNVYHILGFLIVISVVFHPSGTWPSMVWAHFYFLKLKFKFPAKIMIMSQESCRLFYLFITLSHIYTHVYLFIYSLIFALFCISVSGQGKIFTDFNKLMGKQREIDNLQYCMKNWNDVLFHNSWKRFFDTLYICSEQR